MKIVEKFIARSKNNAAHPPVTLAFLGDSVTQGCFEITTLRVEEGEYPFADVFDQNEVYHQKLRRMLAELYPGVPVNIINAGISGGHAYKAVPRLHRDVISHNPDLAVVCFGLNDSTGKEERLERYKESMETIFKELTEAGIETVFLTPNMLCTHCSPTLHTPAEIALAENLASVENEGWLARYLEEAKELAAKYDIPVCDCYAKWKKLEKAGVNVTEMLSNKVSHPTRPMHQLFASSLLETILFE